MAGAAGVEIVRRADARHHRAVLIVDNQYGERDVRAKRQRQSTHPHMGEFFQTFLQVGIDGEPHLIVR